MSNAFIKMIYTIQNSSCWRWTFYKGFAKHGAFAY